MTPTQQFILELLKIVFPPLVALVAGIHIRQPGYMVKNDKPSDH